MEISSTEAQNNFGKYLRIAADLEDVIITKNGSKTAKLISCDAVYSVKEEAVNYLYNQKHTLTYEEFIEMTEKSDLRYEYIDGEVFVLESPVYKHQVAVSEIYGHFHNWFKGKKCRPLTSPFDVTLLKGNTNFNVVQPDILVICDKDKINDARKYKGVPSLVVEVLSPSTKRKDLITKLNLYSETGILEYWAVDPDKNEVALYTFGKEDVMDYTSCQGNMTVCSKVFPGLEIPLKELFTE